MLYSCNVAAFSRINFLQQNGSTDVAEKMQSGKNIHSCVQAVSWTILEYRMGLRIHIVCSLDMAMACLGSQRCTGCCNKLDDKVRGSGAPWFAGGVSKI